MKVLVLDNYDSFTYNLVVILKNMVNEYEVDVFRNDEISIDAVEKYDKIVLSPGPGIPDEAGIMKDLIRQYANSKSILGICLGMQAIAEVFGCKIKNMQTVFHGVSTDILLTDCFDDIFEGIPEVFKAGRYHSWIVDSENLGQSIAITAVDQNKNIMAIKHKYLNVKGLQFHPESIMTDCGTQIIRNWLFDNHKPNLPAADSSCFDLNAISSNKLFC